jgi:hypothetical protein
MLEMRHAPDNPKSNEMPAGIKEEDLAEVISKSGYPLQTVISTQLKTLSFQIEEEWTYIDSDSDREKERNLDILASKALWDYKQTKGQPLISPYLNLLIECKRSAEWPYVFFLSSSKNLDTFPNFTGLKKEYLSVHSEAGTMNIPYSRALSLHMLPFIEDKNEVCMTFSKLVKDGKLTLKADEPYNSIVKPLIKAIQYYQLKEKAKSTYRYYLFHLIVGLVIIDAPMISVRVGEDENELELSPWVRVNRPTSREPEDAMIGDKGFSIDIVHKDYLDKYINEHLLPFASEFARLVRRHEGELSSGESYVNLKKGGLLGYDIESLLRPNKSKRHVSKEGE